MTAWSYIIIGGCLILIGGIAASYGWHIMPKSETARPIAAPIATQKPNAMPLIDLEFERVKADPNFPQHQIQFAYDIIVHNKSSVSISRIHVYRYVIPNKNKQKIAVHGRAQGKIGHFHKEINVLVPGEKKKIYRERSTSYEYVKFDIKYNDEYGKRYHCIFEGDRDGVFIKSNKEIIPNK